MPCAFEISSTGSHFLGSSGAKVMLAMMGSLTPYIQGLYFFFWLRLQEFYQHLGNVWVLFYVFLIW